MTTATTTLCNDEALVGFLLYLLRRVRWPPSSMTANSCFQKLLFIQ